MTKNLKFKIKNSQLAAVLKKDRKEPSKVSSDKSQAKEKPPEKGSAPPTPKGANLSEKEENKPKKVVRARKAPSSHVPPLSTQATPPIESSHVIEEKIEKPISPKEVKEEEAAKPPRSAYSPPVHSPPKQDRPTSNFHKPYEKPAYPREDKPKGDYRPRQDRYAGGRSERPPTEERYQRDGRPREDRPHHRDDKRQDGYRPQKQDKPFTKKMIETPIVKKKEPFPQGRFERSDRQGRTDRPIRSDKFDSTRRPIDREIPIDKIAIPPEEGKGPKKRVEKKKNNAYSATDEAAQSKTEKGKKAPPSYRRQAFSRVFDSRSIEGEETWRRRKHSKQKKAMSDEPIIRPKEISVTLPITVKELASQMSIKGTEVIQKLFMQGLPVTINDALEDETIVELIGSEFDCKINIDKTQAERLQVTGNSIGDEIKSTEVEELVTRPPIVTVMGHVDHGKTSIIDYFRHTNVVAGEAGAITQHIGAFQVYTKHGSFTVLDTPGHEAFSAIRARGANVTDIVVLVIAGDEGIKQQTIEAIQKAKDAKVPIIVAINKLDKPGFNVDDVYRQLSEHELLPEAWGGEVLTVNCSAKTGQGMESLAEMIALQSEVLELKANPNSRARGTVLESELHRGLGITATLLIQNGTLRLGDAVIFEHEYGRIKTMQDEHGKKLSEAPPSRAVKVTGLSGVPSSGSEFVVLADEKEARKISEERSAQARFQELKKRSSKTIEHLMQHTVDKQRKKTLSIILKADVNGSLEAVRETLLNIPTDKVEINFVSSEVGQISESDIERASASGAIIVGFHTKIEHHAEQLLKNKKVKVILLDVIYHIVDQVKEHMISILDKVRKETEIATAKVLATFKSSHLGVIAGCQVTDGVVKRSFFVRQYREGEEVWSGSISSLKRHQDDVKEVKKDLECGIVLNGRTDIKEGDELKFFDVTYITQEL